jgi:hypothetical protein
MFTLTFVLASGFAEETAFSRAQQRTAHFVGSESCKVCHAEVYISWKKTRMANVVRDPKVYPEAVLGDFTHAEPLRTFGLDDVALFYGSR